MLESILPNILLGIAANRIDRHVVEPALGKIRTDPSVERALHSAWQSTIDELFGYYKASLSYKNSLLEDKQFVEARQEWLKVDLTLDQIFGVTKETTESPFSTSDPGDIFLIDGDHAARLVIDALSRTRALDGLPGGLTTLLRQGLVAQFRNHFIEKAITENPNVRDSVFFAQFVAIRRSLGESAESIEG